MTLTLGTFCSGIGSPELAATSLGWKAAWSSEIEPFPSAVLAHHFPDTPNLGDMTKLHGGDLESVDVVFAGCPCQSFSVAGLRAGMDDPRGNLTLDLLRLVDSIRPRWLVYENVPGLLSSNGGRDFGAFLGALAELGYGFAYRVLDAQYCRTHGHERAVPQRRRRVFVVGHSDWRRSAAVLFERESMSGNPPPCREEGEGVAGTLKACTGKSGTANGAEEADRLIVAKSLNAHGMRLDTETETETLIAFSAKDHGADALDNLSPTLRAGGHSNSHANAGVMPAVAFAQNQIGEVRTGDVFNTLNQNSNASGRNTPMVAFGGDTARTLSARHDSSPCADRGMDVIAGFTGVRRLMPVECERLQGFPDSWTDIFYRNKPAADAPRYKAIGNSIAVNCSRWILERIQMVEQIGGVH